VASAPPAGRPASTFSRNVPDYAPAPGDGRVMLEFFVDGDADVDATCTELVDDPDGNTVLVTAG
jgi:hypothetical protein